MFGPGGVLWLLRHELRLSWRGMFARENRGQAGRFALMAFFGLFCLGVGFAISSLLGSIAPQANPATVAGLSVAYILFFTFMLSQALMLITQALYERGDLDVLLASPLPPWRILLVRMGAITLNVGLLYLAFCAAVLVWSPLTGAWRWLGIIPSVLALALCATAAAIVIARILFKLVGPRATRTIAQILAAVFGAAIFLGFQTQNFLPLDERRYFYDEAMHWVLQAFGNPDAPWALPARAALGEPVALGIWFAFALVFYVVAVWWFSRRFVANAAAIASAGRRAKRSTATAAMQGGLLASMVRKEWRLLLRDPLLLSQVLLQLIYLIPLMFLLGRNIEADEFTRSSLSLFSGAIVFIGAYLATSLVWLTVSAEDAPDLIAAAPIKRDDVEFAKAFAAGAPVALLMMAPVVFALWVNIAAAFWLALGAVASIGSAACIGIWHQRPGSRKNFRRRAGQSFVVNLAQFFVTMCWGVATGVAVAGWPIVSLLPAIVAVGLLLALHESRLKPALSNAT